MPRRRADVQRYMDREKLATLGTVNSKNEPCLAPIWFSYSGGKVYMQTDRDSVKVRNLAKNDKAAVTVYSGNEAVVIRGTGRVVGHDEFVEHTKEIVAKYGVKFDDAGKNSLGIPMFDERVRCVIEVTAERLLYW